MLRANEMSDKDLQELLEAWRRSPQPTIKITSYFPAYSQLFSRLRGTECTLIEVGILDGGSLFMWRDWLGDKARIIGVDLNPEAAKWRDSGFEIFIGDQGDPAFWRETLAKIGPFDALIDDGGHQSFQQIVTAAEAVRAAKKACWVIVEDTASSFMFDFRAHGPHSFLQYAKAATDLLVGRQFSMFPDRFPARYNAPSVEDFRNVFSVQFFPGLVAFQVDPERCVAPEVVRNRENTTASDFRYRGKRSAHVRWPALLEQHEVTVKGNDERWAYVTGALRMARHPREFLGKLYSRLAR
jgi:hypothetical protein